MSTTNHLKYPSGRSVQQVKKDAKRLKKSRNITLTDALNSCAKDNGIDLPWDKAIQELKKRALFAVIHEENLALQQRFMPSKEYLALIKRAASYPPKQSNAFLFLDLSALPVHVHQTLLVHPIYLQFIERFMQFTDFDLLVKQPHKAFSNRDDSWYLFASFDGYSGEGDKPFVDTWLEFKDWLMQFGSTHRVRVSERISEPSVSSLVTQTHHEWTPLDFVNKLDLDVDKALYCQMAGADIPFEKIEWGHTDLKVVMSEQSPMPSGQTVALFEYTFNGKVDTVANEKVCSVKNNNIQTRTLMHYTGALNAVMRHHNLSDPRIPFKLLTLDVGKELHSV